MGLLDQFTQAVDARKRYYGNIVRGLLDNPQALMEQLRAQNAENVTERARQAQETRSVMPGIAEPAQRAAFDEAMNMGLLGITAYHGSPHKFDKFDMSKIGTGEGAQAYGHGLYFAENKNVAKSYADALGPEGAFSILDDVLSRNAGRSMTKKQVRDTIAARPTISALADNDSVIDAIKRLLPSYNPKAAVTDSALRDYRLLNDQFEKAYKSQTYVVDIPDEAVAKMLDWDKPLSQQPEAVQGAFRKAREVAGMNNEYWKPSSIVGAQHEYGKIAQKIGPDKASALLKDLGIPGIRYLDAGSRGKGGTSNFVLFDDQLPKIIGRE